MPPRDMPADPNTLSIPCCLAQDLDDPAFREWAQDHPDWFAAGTWTIPARPAAGARPSPTGAATTAPALTQPRTPAQARSDRADAARRMGVGTANPSPPLDPATISLADFRDVVAQAQLAAADLPPPASSLDSDVRLHPGTTSVQPTSRLTPSGIFPDSAATVRFGDAPPASRPRVTADQLRHIMPGAGRQADHYVDAINDAMIAYGIDTPNQRAAFLAQVAVESDDLRRSEENFYYNAGKAAATFRRAFPTEEAAQPFIGHPAEFANRAYAWVNGNLSEQSGDGFRFRGRGLLQITGRENYTRLGLDQTPEALEQPRGAAFSAAAFWNHKHLRENSNSTLSREQFDQMITAAINPSDPNKEAKWKAYQRALIELSTP